MPGGFPIGMDVCNGQTVGANLGSSSGTTITSSGSANTKGSWTQLIAATAYDAVMVMVNLGYSSFAASGAGGSVDIGVGGAGSELVVVQDLNIPNDAGNWDTNVSVIFPLAIKAGTRVAARCQAAGTSQQITVNLQLFDGGITNMEGCAGVDALGFLNASSKGSTIASGVSTNTKGTYTQLSAATARDYIGLFGIFDNLGAAGANHNILLDVSLGAAASELVIIPNVFVIVSSAWAVSPPTIQFVPILIPAGTRLAARCQSNSASQSVGLTLYGVYL